MFDRRTFLKNAFSGLILAGSAPLVSARIPLLKTTPRYQLSLEVCARLFDGKQCWTHPRAGMVPGAGQNGQPRVVMTMNTLDLEGSRRHRLWPPVTVASAKEGCQTAN